MLVLTRVEDPDLGVTRPALLRELPQGRCGAVKVLGIACQNVIGGNMRIELPNDLGKRRRFRGAEPGGDKTGDVLDQRLLALFTLALHRSSLAGRLVGPGPHSPPPP